MKIKLGDTWLAAGGNESVAGLQISHERKTQLTEFVRGAWGGAIPRGNWRHVIRFAVTRLHANIETAEAFTLSHAESLPDQGTLRMEAVDGTTKRWISDAVLLSVELLEYIGATTRFAYTLTGGDVLTTDPDL